jgi:NitT/TauT family transport system ATP-binding protein
LSARVNVENVEVTFSKRGSESVTALSEMSLEMASGDFVSVVGPSGCGKTTLLRAIAGLQPVTAGAVRVDGQVVEKPRRETCVMFQAPTLLPWLSVVDNCLLPAKLRGKVTDADRQKTGELLRRAGLGGFEKSHPYELSGGMQQRVALCRALGADPSLLLLDEPFGALDAMTRDQMNLDLHKIWARDAVTTLLITHSISEAVLLSQRVIVMSSRPGRIVDDIEVPLPRDRHVGVMEEEGFTRTCARIRAHFTRGDDRVNA